MFWLVDPLDGTKEFIKRNGEFTVNIALIEGTEPVMGVVSAPATGLLYAAGRGLGAWKHAPGHPPERLASVPKPAAVPLVVVESRSHPSPELEAFLETVPVARRVQAGSALKFCLVADGTADIYPRFGPTMEWDSAAGDCVYRQSGRDGERQSSLRYNTPTLRNPPFVIGAAGDR
jgi:3'(2'), 5'-bisphosphate nucleotidase